MAGESQEELEVEAPSKQLGLEQVKSVATEARSFECYRRHLPPSSATAWEGERGEWGSGACEEATLKMETVSAPSLVRWGSKKRGWTAAVMLPEVGRAEELLDGAVQ